MHNDGAAGRAEGALSFSGVFGAQPATAQVLRPAFLMMKLLQPIVNQSDATDKHAFCGKSLAVQVNADGSTECQVAGCPKMTPMVMQACPRSLSRTGDAGIMLLASPQQGELKRCSPRGVRYQPQRRR